MLARKEVTVEEEKPVMYYTEYLGGLVQYPLKQHARILIYKDKFAITPMDMKQKPLVEIPYERMTHIETVTGEKRVDTDRALILPIVGLFWKKGRMITIIKYIDKQGFEHTIVTDFRENVKYIQPKLYERMCAAKVVAE
jgi:hypothetical protein